jgi:antitoxin component YwqK of YwqJK toxin-antitoxin module
MYSWTMLMKEGMWHFYYESSRLESEGNYEKDEKKGEWKYYNSKGDLIKTENL